MTGASNVMVSPYVVLNDKGRAVIRGTGFKVTMIAVDHIEGEMTPQQIHDAYPQLSLAAIHAALSYFYDHRAELEAQMLQSEKDVEEIRRRVEATTPPLSRAELERRARERGLRR
jgi:uncharacterized protein (DUF433 family)